MNVSDRMMGVILAAGKGSRMYPFSERMPKPLMPVLNRPLLSHQLESMKKIGIRKVVIVIGHYGFEVVRTIGDGSDLGIEIEYVDQERTLGIAHALGRLETRIDRPFVLFLGDIYFHAPGLDSLLAPILEEKASGVLAAKREPAPEAIRKNFAIMLGEDGRVERVIEKPSYVRTDLKGCGLYAFDLHIFDAVRRTPRTAARDEYEITESIQLLIDDGFRVEVMDGIENDINLTSPADLLAANRLGLKNRGIERMIGEGFSGPAAETIERSVIGKGVSLPKKIKIRDSVVFKGVRLDEERDLDHVIVTPDRVLSVDDNKGKD